MPNGVITGYEVSYKEEGGGQAGTLSGIVATSTKLTGLKPNTTYTISVLAIDSVGDGDVIDIQGTTLVIRKKLLDKFLMIKSSIFHKSCIPSRYTLL